ncbi:MAG: hypothetical protein LBC74_04540, partial [Planctomycetaceae bacterium]|nr:hypothetical protein [Planctomycetaceae bacterium]
FSVTCMKTAFDSSETTPDPSRGGEYSPPKEAYFYSSLSEVSPYSSLSEAYFYSSPLVYFLGVGQGN